MAHMTNPLATPDQLYRRSSFSSLPTDLQDTIFFATQCLTQAAGLLLELPQSVTAQSNVILARYWLVDSPMAHEFSVCVLSTGYVSRLTLILECFRSRHISCLQDGSLAAIASRCSKCICLPHVRMLDLVSGRKPTSKQPDGILSDRIAIPQLPTTTARPRSSHSIRSFF